MLPFLFLLSTFDSLGIREWKVLEKGENQQGELAAGSEPLLLGVGVICTRQTKRGSQKIF